ncbi:MAG: carbohydrate kinase [Deltaproteobacteria bacterium]|nr:carbohydrate kinase [Deltaproteobacteria bacterium]
MTKACRGVVVFGEVLCDLFAHRVAEPLSRTAAFVPLQGGAPANVAVQLARLGVPTTLVTAVGADPLGARLRASLRDDGVDTRCVVERPGCRTGVTFVEVESSGERRFFGFRDNSADLSLARADVESAAVRRALQRAALAHTGTVSLRSPSARQATQALQRAARAAGALVSLDVNLRPGMFPSLARLLSLARTAVRRADVVKATREEAALVLGHTGRPRRGRPQRALDDALVDGLLALGPKLALLTLGEDGAVVAVGGARARVPAPRVEVVDATGAGDGFMGAVLAELSLLPRGQGGALAPDALDVLDEASLAALAMVGCRAGAAVVTAVGATTAMRRGRPEGVLAGG